MSDWTTCARASRRCCCDSSKVTSFPRTVLADAAGQLERMYDELETIHDQVVAESQRWQKKLDATSKQGFEGPEGAHKKEIFDREARSVDQAETDDRRDQRRHR